MVLSQSERMQGTSNHDRDLPASKLPSFHTTLAGPSLDTASIRAHSFTVQGASIHSDPDSQFLALLRFARFVGDVVGSDRVAFLADTHGVGPAFVQAVIPARACSGTTPDPKLDFFACTTHHDVEQLEEADFNIRISAYNGSSTTSNGVALAQRGPFVLSIDYVQEDKADITLSLRDDYGGWIAAKHLAELAVAYLNSGSSDHIVAASGAGLEPSRLNFESFVQAAPQAQHSKSPANIDGVSGTNGSGTACLLHSAFEDNVRRHPNNVAIEYLCRNPSATCTRASKLASQYYRHDITYVELDTRAKDLASELGLLLQVLESQWRPVLGNQYAFPLFIPPSPELFLTELAVLKSGHAFCSLPADAPPERLRAIVRDLGAPIVLGIGAVPWNGTKGSQSEHDQLFEEMVWVDITNPVSWRVDRTDIPDTAGASRIGVRVPATDDLCYLFYTSGSTGIPKGVLGSHRAALACVESTLAGPLSHLPAGPRLRWLNLSAPSFDPVIIDTFVPLSLGGVLCAVERDLLLTDVEACARELRATASYAVASLALLMRPEHMPELKTLIVGGESVNGRVIEKFASAEGSTEDDRNLINAYGPTETTIFCNAESCMQNTRSSVIGDALHASSAFFLLVDPDALDAGDLREMPLGLAGELIVGGPQVACGYLNRPEATARAFIPVDRFPALGLPPGTMLYRTGDKTRVVWSADGKPKIDFLGRIDTDQVKLNGRRVELTEIENVLAGAHGVASVAVVLVKGHERLRAELVAFLTIWTDGGGDGQGVAANCRAEAERLLPDWMCPGSYTILDKLPGMASGKVDRKALVRVATGEIRTSGLGDSLVATGISVGTGNDNGTARAEDNNKDVKSSPMDSSSIVHRGLVAALGDHAATSDSTTPLWSLGLDSLRTMLLLQSARNDGVEDLAMHEVLSSGTVDGLINLIESKLWKLKKASELTPAQAHDHPGQDMALDGETCVVEVDNMLVDIAAIAVDDEEAIYELPIAAKLRHFSHHCLNQCTSTLNLAPTGIEQVLPATNTQTRILYLSTRPEFLDPARYSGRPQVEHFVYDLPLDKLDAGRFRHAVDVVLGRHDCFRAVFCGVKHPLSPFAMCILSKDSELAAVSTVETVCKFDPDNMSLWQSTLVSAQRAAEAAISPGRPGVIVTWICSPDAAHHVMVLSLYHPIFDGVMLTHLREEIALEYAHPGTKLPLLPMRSTVELLLRGNDWAETMFYWMKRFAAVPVFRFGPSQHVPGTVTKTRRTKVKAGLNNETHMCSSALQSSMSMDELATGAISQLSTTVAAVVQAAWASVLAQTRKGVTVEVEAALTEAGNGAMQHKSRMDVQFGSVLHGRYTQDLWRCMAPLLTTTPIHLVVNVAGNAHEKETQTPSKQNPTNREVCRLLTAQHAEAAPYIEVPCPTLDMFEMGQDRFDTVVNLQTYRSETQATTSADTIVGGSGSILRDLPGWSPEQNLLPPYKEVDIGFPVMMEVWPAFGPQGGPDWRGKMTLKCTYNVRKPGYEFLGEEWVAGMLGAFEDALVRVLREPDAEFHVG